MRQDPVSWMTVGVFGYWKPYRRRWKCSTAGSEWNGKACCIPIWCSACSARDAERTKGPMVFLCHKMVSSRKWRMVGIHGLVQKITCTPKWWNNHHIKSLVNCAEIGYSLTFQLPAVIGNFVRLTLEVCSWFYSPAVYAACTYCCMFGYTIGYSTCI